MLTLDAVFLSELDHQVSAHFHQHYAERVVEGGFHVCRVARLVVEEYQAPSLVDYAGTDRSAPSSCLDRALV